MSDWHWEEWAMRPGTYAENVQMYHEQKAEQLREEIRDLQQALYEIELYLAHPNECGHCHEPMILCSAHDGPTILYRCPLCHRVQWIVNIGTDKERTGGLNKTLETVRMEYKARRNE